MTIGKRKITFKPSTTAFLVFVSLFAFSAIYTFWGTWGIGATFVQPDNPTVHSPVWVLQKWKDAVTGGMMTPIEILQSFGGPYVWQELQYAAAAFASALGVAFYLRGRGLSCVSCLAGGMFYGLSGYSLTLFSAGHLGWFMWLVYGPFAFGLADRVVRKGGLFDWVLLGAVLAWASARQPDMWLLFTVFAFFYALWCLVREKGGAMFAKPLKFFGGFAVFLAVLTAIGWPQFDHAISHDLDSRDKQIEATSSLPNDSDKAKKDEARWNFVTGWSMPPEDALEFVAPLVRGCSSDPRISPSVPYWGRLGRASDEVFVPGRMMPNYRQHSLYLGAIACAFALLAVFALFAKRREEEPRLETSADSRDVVFWAVSAIVLFFCAMGRFTPFYRLVYALPFGDYLRAPVKFHHLFEFCSAVLAGYGVEAVLAGASGKRLKAGTYFTMALGLAVLACGVLTDTSGLAASIAKLGYLPEVAQKGAANFSVSCVRGAVMVLAVAFVAAKAGGLSPAKRLAAVAILAVVGAVDMTFANRKYTAVQSLDFALASNAAAGDIAKAGGGSVAIALLPQEGGSFITDSFVANGAKTVHMNEDPDFIFATEPSFRRDSRLAEMRKSGVVEAIGAYSVTEKGIAAVRERPNTFLFKVKKTSRPAGNAKKVSPWSVLSLGATFAVLLACFCVCIRSYRRRAQA